MLMPSFRCVLRVRLIATVAGIVIGVSPAALAQRMITQQVPLRGVSDSFFERNGVAFNLRGPNGFNLNVGGFPQAIPPFGGFQPGAGATGGFRLGGGKFGADVAFEFSQGSRRSMVSQTPIITNMDGQLGIFQDVTQSPFVISTQPIVPLRPGVPWKVHLEQGGSLPPQPNSRSSATKPDRVPPIPQGQAQAASGSGDTRTNRPILSVAEIRRQRQAAGESQSEEALALFQRAEQAASEGKSAVAKITYQMALRRATGELKKTIESRLTSLTDKP